MIKQAMGMGGVMVPQPGYGNGRRDAPTPSAAGAVACDQAIAALAVEFWQRRVNLIRARAVHRLAAGDATAALQDLAAARQAVSSGSDPLYMQSLDVGDQLIRAYAARLSGDHAAAGALALDAFKMRPFDIGVARAALAAMGAAAPSDSREPLIRRLAELHPDNLDGVFVWAFQTGRFEEVIALYPLLQPQPGGDIGNWIIDYRLDYETSMRPRQLAAYLRRDLIYAYALAANGDHDEARGVIEQSRQKLSLALAETVPVGRRTDRDTALIMAARLKGNEVLTAVSAEIADWEARLDGAGAVVLLQAPWTGSDWSVADDSDLKLLLGALPEADTLERTPQYGRKINAWSDANTYKVTSNREGLKTVRYYLTKATAATTGEMALLKIAELAREAGASHALIVDRREMHLSSISNILGTTTANNDNMGTVIEIDARFDAGVTGVETQWRLLDTNAVYTALAPRYIRPVGHDGR